MDTAVGNAGGAGGTVDDVSAVLHVVVGKKLLFKLLEAVYLALYVGDYAAGAGIKSCNEAAEAHIVNLEAVGLVLLVPLKAECAVHMLDAVCALAVLVDEVLERILVVCLVCGAGADAEVVLDLENVAEPCVCFEEVCKIRTFPLANTEVMAVIRRLQKHSRGSYMRMSANQSWISRNKWAEGRSYGPNTKDKTLGPNQNKAEGRRPYHKPSNF